MTVFLRGLSFVIGRLSPQTLKTTAWVLTILLFDVLRARRRVIAKNLNIALGKTHDAKERKAIGRLSVYNFILTIFEFLGSPYRDPAANMEFRGLEHIRNALDQGQGVFVLCCHIGNWEAFGSAVTRTIAPAYIVVKKVGSPAVANYVEDLRSRIGFLTIKRRGPGDGIRGILEVLSRGEIVGFVGDQARPGEPKIPFFGIPAKTNTSLAYLWQKRTAPVLPGWVRRRDFGAHTVEFLPPIELEVTGDPKADILAHTAVFNKVLESVIVQCPQQYFWLHNRWKD